MLIGWMDAVSVSKFTLSQIEDWRYSWAVENLPSMQKALGSIPSTERKKEKKKPS
jgi:hypothetical protein